MRIYPNIEILNGKCVNLRHKAKADPTIYEITPLDAAKLFQEQGAAYLQVVDLDAAFSHDKENTDIIEQIIETVDIPVQVAGGIASQTAAEHWFNKGAERVVIGTAAVLNQSMVEDLITHFPDKIVISIDAKDGYVVTHGWERVSAFTAMQLAKHYENSGIAAIIYTDIDRYHAQTESSMANVTEMATQLNCPIIASGVVTSMDDISYLRQLPKIHGAIVGWALFNEEFTLDEAIKVASRQFSRADAI